MNDGFTCTLTHIHINRNTDVSFPLVQRMSRKCCPSELSPNKSCWYGLSRNSVSVPEKHFAVSEASEAHLVLSPPASFSQKCESTEQTMLTSHGSKEVAEDTCNSASQNSTSCCKITMGNACCVKLLHRRNILAKQRISAFQSWHNKTGQ